MTDKAVDEIGPFTPAPIRKDYVESEYQRGLIEGARIARRLTLDELAPLTLAQQVKIGAWAEAADALGLGCEDYSKGKKS